MAFYQWYCQSNITGKEYDVFHTRSVRIHRCLTNTELKPKILELRGSRSTWRIYPPLGRLKMFFPPRAKNKKKHQRVRTWSPQFNKVGMVSMIHQKTILMMLLQCILPSERDRWGLMIPVNHLHWLPSLEMYPKFSLTMWPTLLIVMALLRHLWFKLYFKLRWLWWLQFSHHHGRKETNSSCIG